MGKKISNGYVKSLVRSVSDHAPLVVNDGQIRPVIHKPFRFELSWLTRADLVDVVRTVWQGHYLGKDITDIIQKKLRKARHCERLEFQL